MRGLAAFLTLFACALLPAAAGAAGWEAADDPFKLAVEDSIVSAFDPLGNLWVASPQDSSGNDGRLAVLPAGSSSFSNVAFPGTPHFPPAVGWNGSGEATWATWDGGSGGYSQGPILAGTRAPGVASAFKAGASPGSGRFPAIAENDAGNAIAVWFDATTSRLKIASRAPGAAGFSAAVEPAGSPTGGTAGGFIPPVAVPVIDADGSATVLFTNAAADGMSQVSRSSATGTWGAATAVGTDGLSAPTAWATNRRGDAVAMFARFSSSPGLHVAYRPHDGAFGAAQTAATFGAFESFQEGDPVVAITGDGHALAAYSSQVQGSTPGPVEVTLRGRPPGADASWSGLAKVTGARAGLAGSPVLNRYLFVWDPPGTTVPSLAAIAAGGSKPPSGAPLPYTATAGGFVNPSVAMDEAGDAFALRGPGRAAFYTAPAEPGPKPPPTLLAAIGGKKKVVVRTNKVDAVPFRYRTPPSGPKVLILAEGIAQAEVDLSFLGGGHGKALHASATKLKTLTFKVKRLKKTLLPGRNVLIKVPLGKKARKALTNAVRHGRRASAKLTIHSSAFPGKSVKLAVKWKRPK